MCHKEVGNNSSGRQTAGGRCARARTRSWVSGEGAGGGGGAQEGEPALGGAVGALGGGWHRVWSAKRAPHAQQAIHSPV